MYLAVGVFVAASISRALNYQTDSYSTDHRDRNDVEHRYQENGDEARQDP
jgi:ABC-type molybdate transport system substrate-binding protein